MTEKLRESKRDEVSQREQEQGAVAALGQNKHEEGICTESGP